MLILSAILPLVRQTRSSAKRLEHDLIRAALTEARKQFGLSTRKLSVQLHKAPTFVARVERGERLLDVVEFVDICEILGLNPSVVLSDMIAKRQE